MSEMMSIQYTKCLKDLKLRSRVLQISMQITENVQSTVLHLAYSIGFVGIGSLPLG
jgi:hypothetical protein